MRLCVVRSFIRISTEKRVLSTIQSYRLMILDGTLRNMSYMFMLCVVMRPAFVRVSFVHECFDVYVIRAYAHMCARHDVCGCMCVYIYVYMYTCIFVHKCICMHTYNICIRVYLCINAYMYAYIYACCIAYVHVYGLMILYIHVRIHDANGIHVYTNPYNTCKTLAKKGQLTQTTQLTM